MIKISNWNVAAYLRLSKEKFDEVQGILNKNKSARSNKEKDLFYSFLKCADCNSSFESKTTKEFSHEEQYKTFKKNIPIVMNKIYKEYINKVI